MSNLKSSKSKSFNSGAIFDITHSPQQAFIPTDQAIINPTLFCKCKGFIAQEFMVACESGEDNCVNGGWLHPQCTTDLCNLTQEQIDQIEVWYCEDCIEKQKKIEQNQLKAQQAKQEKPRPIFQTEQHTEFNIALSQEQKKERMMVSISQNPEEKQHSPQKPILTIDQHSQQQHQQHLRYTQSQHQEQQQQQHSQQQQQVQQVDQSRQVLELLNQMQSQSQIQSSSQDSMFQNQMMPILANMILRMQGQQMPAVQSQQNSQMSTEQLTLLFMQLQQLNQNKQ